MLRSLMAVVGLLCIVGMVHAEDGKMSMENIMKKLHKGKTSVAARAVKGEASAEELATLTAAYKAMADMKPPKGDVADWKKRVAAVQTALASAAPGKPSEALKTAIDCKGCHEAHRED
ncbi:MAG: hypothetical protein GC162_03300 [Planctomycetes bacterium]|nr:hypothetical protein [Planctomycetota bacterium]